MTLQLDEIPKGRNGRNGIVIRDKVARNVEMVVPIVGRTFSMGFGPMAYRFVSALRRFVRLILRHSIAVNSNFFDRVELIFSIHRTWIDASRRDLARSTITRSHGIILSIENEDASSRERI